MTQIRFAILSLLFLQNMAFSSHIIEENTEFSNNSEAGKNIGKSVKNLQKNYSVPPHDESFFLTDDEDSGTESDATYDSNNEFELLNQKPIQSVGLSRFQAREVKRKRPFVSSKALRENSPPVPKSLAFEKNSSWFYFNEGAIHSYAGMTRSQRKQLKKLGHQHMLPSPPKKTRPPREYITKNNRRLFETSEALQGFSRESYQFMVLEGRENLSLDEALKPILDHFQTQLDAKIPVTPDEINKLFWDQISPFFDIQEKVGDHIFCLNKKHIQETDALTRITTGRNPLLQTGGVTQKGDYHHLTQGLSSPEIVVYVPTDFHTRYHDLLHPFLKPGMDSVAHAIGTEREWSQAKKQFHLTLVPKLKQKEEQSIKSANKRSHPADSQNLEPSPKKGLLLTNPDFLD